MTFINNSRSYIRINVGGKIFILRWNSVKRFHNSRLEQIYRAVTEEDILRLCDEYDKETGEYFFDRHPKSFENVWNLLQSGQFYFDTEFCAANVLEDLQYWGISLSNLPFCCRYAFERRKEIFDEEKDKVKRIMHRFEIAKRKSEAKFSKCRGRLWNIMEHPETSILARIMAVISILFIAVSTVCLVISTLPDLHKPTKPEEQNNEKTFVGNISLETHEEKSQNDVFEIIEYVCITWFTMEYVLRLISVSKPLHFLKEFLNIIDFISIAPFFLTLLVTTVYKSHNDKLESISKVVQVFRVLRILRVLKLARHSVGLQSLGYTLQKSYKELGLLVSFIAMGVSLFSSLVYFAEKETNSAMFKSIPHTFWWSIISMTTVGYGDIHPNTTLGQTFASICCVTGVLVIALPIPIIVSNFSEFYKDKLRIEKTLKRKEEMEKAKTLGSFVLLNTFAQNAIGVIQPFIRGNETTLSCQRVSVSKIWNTNDWKFMDYSSSGCESSCDEKHCACKASFDL